MAISICHVVGVAKRVRLERFVRRDHPAEMTARQGRLNRSLENRAHPANYQRRTRRSRTHWAGNVTASTRRSKEHTSELQSLMRISSAVFSLQKKKLHIRHRP